MRFPDHIILELAEKNLTHSSQYWVFKYLSTFKNDICTFDDLSFHRKFFLKKENLMLNKILKNQKKYTVRYNYTNPAVFLPKNQKELYKNLYKTRIKVKHRLLFSKHYGKEIYDYLYTKTSKFDEKSLRRLFKNFKYKTTVPVFKSHFYWNLFDINFLRKEKIYTKLKYSRVPQYDLVSGGSAALFAGLLGFLITEKFGFELLDSGDFYYLFMYFVFFCFFGRLLFAITSNSYYNWNIFSPKWLFFFNKTLIILFFRFIKKTFITYFK